MNNEKIYFITVTQRKEKNKIKGIKETKVKDQQKREMKMKQKKKKKEHKNRLSARVWPVAPISGHEVLTLQPILSSEK